MKAKLKTLISNFTAFEKALWFTSVLLITLSFILFKGAGSLSLVTSLLGVTSLIFCAKGNPIGQALIIVFSLLYGIISYTFSYYGEMITYAGMTLPMAVVSLVVWLKNPYGSGHSQVVIRKTTVLENTLILLVCVPVTAVFYFILKYLNTANIIPSTISIATSAAAVIFTSRRSALYALAYALNDIVLVVLWLLASLENSTYVPVTTCFAVFLANDIYAFISWNKLFRVQLAKS